MLGVLAFATACDPPVVDPPPPEIRGLADFHAHQFAHLGFGGNLFVHSNDPADECMPILSSDVTTMNIRDLVRSQLFEQAALSERAGQCATTWSSGVSQRMDTENLKRAWSYGLRLMVMFAESSDFLCLWGDLADPCPSDYDSLKSQIEAAYAFEAKIAAEDGGWYQIVTSAEEARDVINEGNLAVVLGIEATNAFGCEARPIGVTTGVPHIPFGRGSTEEILGNVCRNDDDSFDPGLPGQRALAMFEEYYNLGVRHFFPIHEFDSIIGGAGLSIPQLHSVFNPVRLNPGGVSDRVGEMNRVILETRPPVNRWVCGDNYDFDDPDGEGGSGGFCNTLGLTREGKALIPLMASYGAIIDIDHMSLKAKAELTSTEDDALLGGYYPLVSGHSGVVNINHGDKRNEIQLSDGDFEAIIRTGGAIAPIIFPANTVKGEDTYPPGSNVPYECAQTTEGFVQSYRYVVEELRSGQTMFGKPAYVGVGYGSDFHAPVSSVAPRFIRSPWTGRIPFPTWQEILFKALGAAYVGSPTDASPGYCYLPHEPRPRVQYPFTSPLTGAPFGMSTTPWTHDQVPYDISYDGVAHVGMIPDMVAEMQALGVPNEELEPLWHGAEAYLRTWEHAQSWASAFASEGEQHDQCAYYRAQLLPHVQAYNVQLDALFELRGRPACFGIAALPPYDYSPYTP